MKANVYQLGGSGWGEELDKMQILHLNLIYAHKKNKLDFEIMFPNT